MDLAAQFRPAMEGLKEFLSWWASELMSVVPDQWQQRFAGTDKKPILLVSTEKLALFEAEDPGLQTTLWEASADGQNGFNLQELPAAVDDRDIHIRFDRSLALEKSLPMPPLSAADTERAIMLQIERHFPYRAEDVYVGFSRTPKTGADGVSRARVAVAERGEIDRILGQLRGVGIRPASYSFPSRYELLGIPALHNQEDHQSRYRWALLGAIAIFSAALLLFAWHGYRDGYISFLESQIATQRQAAVESRAVVDRVAEIQATRQWLGDQVARPSLNLVLNGLAGQLPDAAWIDQFEWNTDRLRLRGLADDAVGLPTLLEDHRLFHNVQFSGAVTARSGDGKERFDLTAQTATP